MSPVISVVGIYIEVRHGSSIERINMESKCLCLFYSATLLQLQARSIAELKRTGAPCPLFQAIE